MSAVPDGWEMALLGDLCRIELGSTPARGNARLWDTDKATENVWLSISDMLNSKDAVVTDSREYVSDAGAKQMRLIPSGTLLVSFKLTLGRLCYAGRDLYTNEAIAALLELDHARLSKEYLYWYLTFFDWDAASEGDEKVKGKTLNKAKLKVLPIIIPPLDEQKRIVAVLDQAFAALDRARTNAEANMEDVRVLANRLKEDLIQEFVGEVPMSKIGDCCELVRGPFGGSLKKSIFKKTGFAVYEQQHAIHRRFKSFRYFVDQDKFDEMVRFRVSPGDVIMSCSGTMGRVAVVPESAPRGIINQALLKISPSKSLLPEFLKRWMESAAFQSQLSANKAGVAIENVASVSTLRLLEIPILSLSKQAKVVEAIDAIDLAFSEVRQRYDLKSRDTAALRQSVLQAAFSGQLT